jgi:hypothetical protein
MKIFNLSGSKTKENSLDSKERVQRHLFWLNKRSLLSLDYTPGISIAILAKTIDTL